jgi:hypothetical protein
MGATLLAGTGSRSAERAIERVAIARVAAAR